MKTYFDRVTYRVQCFTFAEYRLALGGNPLLLRIIPKHRAVVPGCQEARAALATEIRRLRACGLDRHEVRRRYVQLVENPRGLAIHVDIARELLGFGGAT